MIRLLLKLPIVLLLGVPVTWVAVLLTVNEPARLPEAEVRRLTEAYPRSQVRERILRNSAAVASSLGRVVSGAGSSSSATIRGGLVVSAIHSRILTRLLPLEACLLAIGIVAGLILRERMRDAEGYASPTAAGLGRGLVGAGLFWCGLFAFTPLPMSSSWLYGAMLCTSIGGGVFMANVPLKI
jgi:hypothetical protein